MTAVMMMVVAVAAQIIGGNWEGEFGGGGGGGLRAVAGVEKYNFSSSIAVSVITACHA